jgi:hypothetical protein
MSERAIPHIKRARKILETASKLPGLSHAVRSGLKDYAEDLDYAVEQLKDEWLNIIPKSRHPLPKESQRTERRVMTFVYKEFGNREFSENEIGDYLWNLVAGGVISKYGASRYGHAHRLFRQGIISFRHSLGEREYKFNRRGHRILSDWSKKIPK